METPSMTLQHYPVAGNECIAEPSDMPATPHQAYVRGWDAARKGVDLATVVYDAILKWPGKPRELAELITCASLGYWTEGGPHG